MTEKPTYRDLEKRIQELERSQSEIKHAKSDFEKELRLRTVLLDNIPDCIALIIKKGSREIVASNKVAQELGAVPGQLCFKKCAMRDDPCSWCQAPKLWETDQLQRIEVEYRGVWYKGIWAPFDEDLYIHYIFNITERKRVEESLRNSEYQLNSHIKNTPVGVVLCDFNHNITEWNPAAEAIFGYSEAEALGKNVIELIVPGNVKRLVVGLFKDLLSEKENVRSINENITKDGRYIMCDWYNTVLKDADGKVIGMAALVLDVTATKEIDRKLKKLNGELENRIKERTSSLEDVNTALRVLLKKREEDKNQIGENIYANFKSVIQPLLNQLKISFALDTHEDILEILETSIKEMTTSFSKKLADPIMGLTPTEIQVAALVKEGKTNKEITKILNKSIRAVSSHRDNIRQKLGLKNKKKNLRSYLLSLG